MPEKRNYRRFSYGTSIFLKFGKDASNIIEGKVLDIGFVGMSIFIKGSENAESLIQATVQFDSPGPAGQHLIGKGKVVHLKKRKLYAEDGFIIGLEFVEVDKDVVLNILDRLEANIRDELRKNKPYSGKNPELF